MKRHLLFFFVCVILAACQSHHEPKTVFVVRHAEKMTDSDDPGLNEIGKSRAQNLSRIMEGLDIKHVFSTPTIRTRATVQPLASKNGLEISDYDVNNHDELVRQLKSRKGNILVVGHSNTIHHLLNYFVGSGQPFTPIDDADYEDIFLIHLNTDGTMGVEKVAYKDYL